MEDNCILTYVFFFSLQSLIFCSGISNDKNITTEVSFGYISHSTTNIGDDIQALAAKQFLPTGSIPINREFSSSFFSQSKIHTIINAWFMHTKDNCWWWATPSPEKLWPPSANIDPILISIHFTPKFLPIPLSKEGIQYLIKHSPVGARDIYTFDKLQEKNILTYFSGCVTLTLNSSYPPREEIIYAVDIDSDCLHALQKYAHTKIVQLTHGVPLEEFHETNHEKRMA